MSDTNRIYILPEGGCYRIKVQTLSCAYTKSYSTLTAAAADAAKRGLILLGTANELILRGMPLPHGWSGTALRMEPEDLEKHYFVCI